MEISENNTKLIIKDTDFKFRSAIANKVFILLCLINFYDFRALVKEFIIGK